MNALRITSLTFIAFLFMAGQVMAAGFQLTRIGSLDTTGYQYPEWWYSSENPTLYGTTAANATVEVAVNGNAQTVTADASGNWSAPITAAAGDHNLVLTSNTTTYAFTLHIGSSMPAGVGTPSATAQPVAGSLTPTLAVLAMGLGTLALGLRLAKSK